MSDIASIGFRVDTAQLLAGDVALQRLAATAEAASRIFDKLNATAAQAFKNVPAAFGGGGAASPSGSGGGGLFSPSAAIADQDRLTTSLGKTTAALAAATTAHKSHGAAAHGNALAIMELEHVGRSLFDVMASGGSVFRGLLMESGRLQIAFEQGLGSAFGNIAQRAAGFLNPLTIGGAALAGLGAAAALATSRVHDLDVQMNRAVGGAGRYSGLSGTGLQSLAAGRAADLAGAGLNLGDARASAMALARTGTLDATGISSVMGLVPGYAGLTGTSFGKAGEGLAKIFADPARGMSDLESAVGALDDRTRQSVLSLKSRGEAEAAVKLLVDQTSTALNAMVQPQSGWSRFTNWWSNRNAQVEGAIAGEIAPDPQTQYLRASRAGGSPGMLGALQARGLYDDGTSNLAEDFRHSAMLRGASPMMRSEADELGLNKMSTEAGDIIRSVLPDIAARQRLTDQQAGLSKALGNPDVLNRLGPNAADAFDALDRLNTGLRTFKTGLQLLAEQGDFATRQALARTASQRATVDADRAYITTLERTHSVLEAAQAAENSRNEAIAASTRTALDALRSTSDRASLVGLSPFDRILKENDQRFRDLQERAITGPIASGTAIDVGGSRYSGAVATPAMIEDAAGRNGLPASILSALGQVENGGRLSGGTNILDASGRPASSAYGFGQITTGAESDIRKVLPGFDRTNPDTAVLGAATYLKQLVDRNHGDMRAALGAYAGPDPNHDGSGNSAYVANVFRLAGNNGMPAGAAPQIDTGAATLANRLNFATGRQADVSDLLMRGPTQAGLQLDAQARTLAVQGNTFGQSASMIAAATEAQKEWNQVASDGVTQQKLQNAFGEAGAKMWADLTAKIGANAAEAGKLSQQQQDMQAKQQLMGTIGNDAADVLSAGTIGALTGKGFGKSAGSALFGIGQSLIRSGFSSLFGGIFGGGKGGGGSLLGSLFGGGGLDVGFQGWMPHFAAGTDDAPGGVSLVGEKGPELVNLPAHAQVIPNSALANMRASSSPTFQFGDVHIHPVGGAQFTPDQIQQIRGQVAQAQQDTVEHITRNLPQIQADSTQF